MIFGLRTTVGQELLVVDVIRHKVEKEGLLVYSLGVIPNIKGYILIEAEDEHMLQRTLIGVPNVKSKGIIAGTIKVDELSTLLEAKPLMKTIKEGMKVELIAGPFKGQRAKITRVNETKEEVTVELMEAAVKIPVTIHAEHIRILNE